jgi:GH18 family chitinase
MCGSTKTKTTISKNKWKTCKPNAMWTGHNSPLFGRPEEESEDSPGYHWNANFSAHYWLEGGARKSQLLLGLAAYGRGFTLANEVRDYILY